MKINKPAWNHNFGFDLYKIIIISFSVIIFSYIVNLPTPEGLTPNGLKSLGIFFICVIFWVTNVIPLMITSMLAVILFPLMGVLDSKTAFSFFGNNAVFFILGAFILASSMIRSGLSTRIATLILLKFGNTPRQLLITILILPAFMSFFFSAHAVAALMYPIVVEIAIALHLTPGKSNYGKSLFLASAWGCTTGSIATFLGGARAALAVGILTENTGKTISFMTWFAAAIPTVIGLLGVAYIILSRFFPIEPLDIHLAQRSLKKKTISLGRLSIKEIAIGFLMLCTIITWIVYGSEVGLANIALGAVVIAFIFNLMEWKDVEEDVNWGVFLMYGGAISMGYALNTTGTAEWLAHNTLGAFIETPKGLLVSISFLSIFFTEAISNSAVIAFMMPICLSLANDFSVDPVITTLALAIPSGLAYVLPMGTPATALAYSSGYLGIKDIIIPGIIQNLMAWIIFAITALTYWPLIGLHY